MARGRFCPCVWDRWSPRCWVFGGGEDTVGVDDNAAAADPNHATRIISPLRKRGNRRPDVGERLPLCM